eukprot:7300030-Prorocentrum_lima.AAC.1
MACQNTWRICWESPAWQESPQSTSSLNRPLPQNQEQAAAMHEKEKFHDLFQPQITFKKWLSPRGGCWRHL